MRIVPRSCRSTALIVVTFFFLIAMAPLQAANLTITPASITNDYVGKIALNITGLSTGQKVWIQGFYDLNTNGVVDPGEIAIRQAVVTDGEMSIIGGITNLLVPADMDGAANGQIQVLLNYPGANSVLESAIGRIIYVISDEQTDMPLATNVFTLTQKVLPQGVRGRITAATGGFALSNAVVALSANGGPGGSLCVTDSNGNYQFYAQPGSYVIVPVVPGYVADQNAGFVTVTASQFVTNNQAVSAGGWNIAGRLSDAGNSAKGIGGVFMQAETSDNLFVGGFTDAGGNYVLSVSPNQWKIKPSNEDLAERGYVKLQNNPVATVVSANVSNIDFSLPKANALIYGFLRDTLAHPVGGISFSAGDSSDTYNASGFSETNGSYTIGVVAGNWNANPDNDSLSGKGYGGVQSSNVTVSAGQAVRADFVAQQFTCYLVGRAVDNLGNPLVNFGVNANDNASANSNGQTDNNGYFALGISGGSWSLNLDSSALAQAGLAGPQLNFNVTDGVSISNIVMVAQHAPYSISGSVRDQGSNPVNGVGVYGNTVLNGTNYSASAMTSGNGNYSLPVFNGTWQVFLDCNDLSQRGFNCPANTNVNIIGGNGSMDFIVHPLIVLPRPAITAPNRLSNTQFQFTASGAPGLPLYTFQYSTNLANWTSFLVTNAPNAPFPVTDPSATNKLRFYRILIQP